MNQKVVIIYIEVKINVSDFTDNDNKKLITGEFCTNGSKFPGLLFIISEFF